MNRQIETLENAVEFIEAKQEMELIQLTAKQEITTAKALAKAKTEFIIPDGEIIDFKEAVLIAYAGFLRVLELPNFISEATGAKYDTIGGAMYISNKAKRL